tara:strand:+ start:918 stop:1157 length:240 start_codon:yes stop_codon:yes gene_type:complete
MEFNMRLIKVVFLLKAKPPASLNNMEYFAYGGSYDEAQEKAETQLKLDLMVVATRLNSNMEDLLRHFTRMVLTDVSIIG